MRKGPGRPLKSRGFRVQITIYADSELLESIDKKVRELRDVGDTSMSRSELFHRAMTKFLGL